VADDENPWRRCFLDLYLLSPWQTEATSTTSAPEDASDKAFINDDDEDAGSVRPGRRIISQRRRRSFQRATATRMTWRTKQIWI
jgi:hypothetical protein